MYVLYIILFLKNFEAIIPNVKKNNFYTTLHVFLNNYYMLLVQQQKAVTMPNYVCFPPKHTQLYY